MSVLLVSLAGRRWGPALSGRLTALPLTSGPLVLIVAGTQGTAAGHLLASGVLAGMPTVVVFCVLYLHLARRWPWPACLPVAFGGTAACVGALSLLPALPAASAVLVGASALLAKRLPASDHRSTTPAWELPVRMILTTMLVQGLAALSPFIGPRLAGVLATFPALAVVLAVMAHRRSGAGVAIELLRGVLAGLLPTAVFFVVLTVVLGRS